MCHWLSRPNKRETPKTNTQHVAVHKYLIIIQLFGQCMATWYAMSQSLIKLTEIETSWGRGVTVTQKPNNTRAELQSHVLYPPVGGGGGGVALQ